MAGKLEGRVAWITGGGSGIGRATALRFAEEGAAVAVADFNLQGAEETARLIEAAGGKAVAQRLDVTDEEAVEAAASEVVSRLGKLDACLAAAGVLNSALEPPRRTAIIDKPTEDWMRVINVNVHGLMFTNRAAGRRMVSGGTGGTIVNIASSAAKIPMPMEAEYPVSKAAVWMLTKCIALELAPLNVRVNAIGPGIIETGMTQAFLSDEAVATQMVKTVPMQRVGQPREIANTALFLSCDDSSYFTGQILFPNGGIFIG